MNTHKTLLKKPVFWINIAFGLLVLTIIIMMLLQANFNPSVEEIILPYFEEMIADNIRVPYDSFVSDLVDKTEYNEYYNEDIYKYPSKFKVISSKVHYCVYEQDRLKVFVTTSKRDYQINNDSRIVSIIYEDTTSNAITFKKDKNKNYIVENRECYDFLKPIGKVCTMPASNKKIIGLRYKIMNGASDLELKKICRSKLAQYLDEHNLKDYTYNIPPEFSYLEMI